MSSQTADQKKKMSKGTKVAIGLGSLAVVAAVGGVVYWKMKEKRTKEQIAAEEAKKDNTAVVPAAGSAEDALTEQLIAISKADGVVLTKPDVVSKLNLSIIKGADPCTAAITPSLGGMSYVVVAQCPQKLPVTMHASNSRVNAEAWATTYNQLVKATINKVVAAATAAPTPVNPAAVTATVAEAASKFYDEGYENFW